MSDFRLRKQKKEQIGKHYDIFNRPKKRPNSREAVFDDGARKEFVMGFHERKDLRRKKAQEDLKELEKKTRREGRKMRQQHMLAVLNQMRGIGDVEEGLRPKEEGSEEESEEQVLEQAAYEDNTYKITTEVADVVEKKKKGEDANESEEDEDDEAGELESNNEPTVFNPKKDYSKLVKPAPKKRTKRRRDTYSHSAAKKNAKKRRKQ